MDATIARHRPQSEFATEEDCFIIETWNDPGDPALSVARARVEAGVTTRWHRLRGVAERYLIVAGQGVVEVGESPPTAVGPGDLVVIPAGVRQRIHNPGPRALIFYALCTPRFTPDCYEALAED
ncbi:cupin domain-containing protein [Thiohalobacter sp. IOR34]|uniref:cupin domain-containing protein n=1 Tax=Thiohalobacter sp. IOR34 TaxID=3057176 RepID=UPI0025B16A29|nr:cupin domain-containing protein [Thiohalobacter sp. IOR34]WJW76115.1 cupin domain-containing protein [Thiohalobacter sp. IOR34]